MRIPVEIPVTLTTEYLDSLRKSVEHMREHNLALQDMRGENTLALLDRVEELEKIVAMFMEDPHAYTPRAVAAALEAGFTESWTLPHHDKCGCATCLVEFPRRFAAPVDP